MSKPWSAKELSDIAFVLDNAESIARRRGWRDDLFSDCLSEAVAQACVEGRALRSREEIIWRARNVARQLDRWARRHELRCHEELAELVASSDEREAEWRDLACAAVDELLEIATPAERRTAQAYLRLHSQRRVATELGVNLHVVQDQLNSLGRKLHPTLRENLNFRA